jgi:hypothetical protein
MPDSPKLGCSAHLAAGIAGPVEPDCILSPATSGMRSVFFKVGDRNSPADEQNARADYRAAEAGCMGIGVKLQSLPIQ